MPLPRYRKLNVQQQNAVVEDLIRREAMHWRQNPLPEALKESGSERGIQWERSIIINLCVDFPGMPRLSGLLLTQDERFVDFEIETDAAHRVVESVEVWKDVTATQNTNERNRGIGAGSGAIAIKVLRTLNS
ncbi:hypothetical protein J2789_007256 [Variovorax paradoxus]|uniref:hypothetical protein n=1 Tax=Variovorax atrisoli TaxID=3394203 RepID=UPI00119AE079|nr:hypothetical protein [Variovorax paradoxus]MDR6524542.1 hypothetical protein [Variovorax paradoxus]